MATTDARTGFRLPWSAEDRAPIDTPADGEHAAAEGGWPVADFETHADGPSAPGAVPAAEAAEPVAAPRGRAKPSKFLADLTKAMQATAEAAREEVLGRLRGDAKTHVEQIHGLAAEESTNLRRRADDDVAAVREWSKTEIARIREETEQRITDRKSLLEREIEENAARIERRIERVQATVDAFEAEMATFFERLLLEDDPTRFATMAENLPEPPTLTVDFDDEPVDPAETAEAAVGETAALDPAGAGFGDAVALEADAEAVDAAAFGTDAPAVDTTDVNEPGAGAVGDTESAYNDPRIAVLGLTPDSAAAAEAEAFAAVEEGEDIPVIPDDTLAARLAGLVPQDTPTGDAATTNVVVVGLVSVASIASFKRHLSRLPGVQGVGVTSGPDGEFVFAVMHGHEVVLRDAVPSLPGFQARVTGADETSVTVAAHDPETDASPQH